MQRFKLLSDESGHDYIIPIEQEDRFYKWIDATENGDDTSDDFEDQRINCSGWTFTDPKDF